MERGGEDGGGGRRRAGGRGGRGAEADQGAGCRQEAVGDPGEVPSPRLWISTVPCSLCLRCKLLLKLLSARNCSTAGLFLFCFVYFGVNAMCA
jgi:hypothetical protein